MSSIIGSESGNYYRRRSKHLPNEIIEMILKRLCLPDSVRCGAVCKTWRNLVGNAILTKFFNPKAQLPWIMLPEEIFQRNLSYKFFSLDEDRAYELKIPENNFLGRGSSIKCLGSIDGWLMMREFHQWRIINFFLNPLSGARVQLPTSIGAETKFTEKVVASSIPTCSNCFVAECLRGGGGDMLAFCEPNDKTWTIFMTRRSEYRFVDIEFHEDGNLYALDDNMRCIIIVDPREVVSERNDDIYMGKELVLLHPVPALKTPSYFPKFHIKTSEFPYLVKSSGIGCELLLVLRCFQRVVGLSFTKTTGFRVFKLEKSGPCWLEVKTLEDQILFLNDGGGFSMSNLTTPLTNKTLGTGNCIYCKTNDEVVKFGGPVWFTPNP